MENRRLLPAVIIIWITGVFKQKLPLLYAYLLGVSDIGDNFALEFDVVVVVAPDSFLFFSCSFSLLSPSPFFFRMLLKCLMKGVATLTSLDELLELNLLRELLRLLCFPLSMEVGGTSTKAEGNEALAGIDLVGCLHLNRQKKIDSAS